MKLHRWIVLLVLTIIAAAAPIGQSAAPRRIEIAASRFSYSPSEITLKKGEPVVLVLTSLDVTHGLAVSELGIRKEVVSGRTTEIAFTPMRTGTFEGKCSHLCGKGHLSMVLKLNVVN
jgi:cytochrome c oxidase subunit II